MRLERKIGEDVPRLSPVVAVTQVEHGEGAVLEQRVELGSPFSPFSEADCRRWFQTRDEGDRLLLSNFRLVEGGALLGKGHVAYQLRVRRIAVGERGMDGHTRVSEEIHIGGSEAPYLMPFGYADRRQERTRDGEMLIFSPPTLAVQVTDFRQDVYGLICQGKYGQRVPSFLGVNKSRQFDKAIFDLFKAEDQVGSVPALIHLPNDPGLLADLSIRFYIRS
jgi:hypothetical protein